MNKNRPKVRMNYFRSSEEPFDWKMRFLDAEYKTGPYTRNMRPNKDMVIYYSENKLPDYQFGEYLIYNSYVKTMLLWYKYQYSEFSFAIEDLNNYDYFRAIISNFIKVFDLNCDLRTVDKFLWTAGKEFFPQYVYKDLLEKYKPQTNKSS